MRVGTRWRTTSLFANYFFVRVVDRWRIMPLGGRVAMARMRK
jgi:hypothetical protein